MNAACYRFQRGIFEFVIVKDGTGGTRSLSELVDPVPRDLTSCEIDMEGGIMVVDAPDQRFLVDGGNGPLQGPRQHRAEVALEKEGIPYASIDTVLLTHGDPDHISGLLTQNGDLACPDAQYVMNIDLWRALYSEPGAGLYFPSQTKLISQLARLIEGRCTLLEMEREIWPGVRVIPAPGHRVGHSIFRFGSLDQGFYHIGDAAFHPLFLERPDLLIPSEYRPAQACATRAMIAQRALAERARIVGSHFRVTNVGALTPSSVAGQYRWFEPSQ